MNTTDRELVALIPTWLAVTRGGEIATGLSRDEAFSRARLLRRLLAEGKASPDSVVLDEDMKDVSCALVRLVTEVEPLPNRQLADEADRVYQFVARVEWEEDDFDEQRDLLVRCAVAGWHALGLTPGHVRARRSFAEATQTIPLFKPDPLALFLASLARLLREQRDSSPSIVLEVALIIHRWISGWDQRLGLFDERDHLLGEFAFLAGCAYRCLGKREEAFHWLDRAEAGLRHTVNPAAGLANIGYARLALRYEMGHFEDVLDLVPSLTVTFEELGMPVEEAKCVLLRAAALKQRGRLDEALRVLEPLPELGVVQGETSFHARVLAEIGDVRQQQGRSDLAMVCYEKALALLANEGVSMARADLKMFLGGLLSGTGDHESGLAWCRSAATDYGEMGMATRLAYVRLLVADELIALERPREAEWEILQALPTIEEQKMAPEGLVAVALLRESVKRRKTDPTSLSELRERPEALRQLREHLQRRHGS